MKNWYEAAEKYRKQTITQSFQNQIDRQIRTISSQNNTIKEQQEFILSPARKYLVEGISQELSTNIVKHIHNALKLTSYAKSDEIVSIEIPAIDLRSKMPSEVEGRLINRYIYKLNSNLNFGVMSRPSREGYKTFYSFQIPSMNIEVEKVEALKK